MMTLRVRRKKMFGFNENIWKEKGGEHTSREIYQQPELWLEALEIIEANRTAIEKFMEERLGVAGARVIFSGAGTSAYIGDIVAPSLSKDERHSYEAIPTTDIVSDPQIFFKKDTPTILVSFARSGNSPESVATYDLANQLVDDISHVFITCNPEGELAKISQDKENVLLLLMPEKSNDKSLAMTSSYSCMVVAALLAFDMKNFEDNKKQIIEMAKIGKNVLDSGYREMEDLLNSDFERVVYLGSSSLYGASKESALKLLELTGGQIISHNESVLGFRHGPKSIINDKTLVFVYISHDEYSRKYDLDLLRETHANHGDHTVIAISKEYTQDLKETCDYNLALGENVDLDNKGLIALLYTLYAQVFALLSSVKVGLEPDNPNPTGLINRVVQGVVIYPYK